ncbi:MAG: FeoC-like transcriptional regulator [Solirubrobacterales bacterium]
MILTEIQAYLDDRGRASVAECATRFDVAPGALSGMLDRLAAKGRVRRLPTPKKCLGCQLCPPEELDFYERCAPGTVAQAPAAPCADGRAG